MNFSTTTGLYAYSEINPSEISNFDLSFTVSASLVGSDESPVTLAEVTQLMCVEFCCGAKLVLGDLIDTLEPIVYDINEQNHQVMKAATWMLLSILVCRGLH